MEYIMIFNIENKFIKYSFVSKSKQNVKDLKSSMNKSKLLIFVDGGRGI